MKLKFIVLLFCLLCLSLFILLVINITLKSRKIDEVPNSNNQTDSEVKTHEKEEKTYTGNGFSFTYPSDILIYPQNPQPFENVYITNKENITGPREMPTDGIWVEATAYPEGAKTSLIKDVKKILDSEIGTVVTHPITPYSDKFTKVKNLEDNGFIIKSTNTKDVNDAQEIESAIWLKGNFVYQLRIVVIEYKTFQNFEENFNKIIASFKITN